MLFKQAAIIEQHKRIHITGKSSALAKMQSLSFIIKGKVTGCFAICEKSKAGTQQERQILHDK
jgi:hypothetical protein